jgi:hypothetical protein
MGSYREYLGLVLDLDLDQMPIVQRSSIKKAVQAQDQVQVQDCVSIRRLQVSDFNERLTIPRASS